MQPNVFNILVIDDNPGDLLLFNQYLKLSSVTSSRIIEAGSLTAAEKVLNSDRPDIIFLDLFLPDSEALDTFSAINAIASTVPIIILSGLDDSETALKAIQLGAQDYLIKGDFDEKILSKAIYYSIERKRIQESLNVSLEKHQLVGQATSDIIWDWNLETNQITHLSEALESNFGYTAAQLDNNLQWWYDRVHPNDIEALLEKIAKTIERCALKGSHEFRFKDSRGTYKHVYARALILYKNEDKCQAYRMLGAMQDITQLKGLQEKIIHEKVISQRRITEATIQSQEREREELAKELHDNINQILTAGKLYLDLAIKNTDLREEFLAKSYTCVNNVIDEIRKLSKSLVPPSLGDIGLQEAIEELLATMTLNSGIRFNFISLDLSDIDIASQVQLMIYRIIQEQLNNVIKHAHANEVVIQIKSNHEMLQVSIADNGIGFDLSRKVKGIGLRNIKSRAEVYGGKVKISTAPGKGCTLHIFIPVQKDKTLNHRNSHEEVNRVDS